MTNVSLVSSSGIVALLNASHGSSSNSSSGFGRQRFPRILSALLVYYAVVVLIVAIIGNSLALAACLKTYLTRPSVLLGFLISLTAADVLFAFLAAFDSSVHFAARGDWPCKVEGFLTEVCFTAAILILDLISYERMKVVSAPILARVRRFRFRKWLPILIWLLALFLCVPVLFFFTKTDGHCTNTGLGNTAKQVYYGLQTIVLYLFSLLYMLWAHARIFKTLTSHASFRKGTTTTLLMQSEQKLTRMLVAVIAVFCICYTPYMTIRMFKYFGGVTGTSVAWLTVWRVAELLVFTQTGINPFIFCFFSKQFRIACKEILKCQCKVKRGASARKVTRTISGTTVNRTSSHQQ